jgi:hypothetical protein
MPEEFEVQGKIKSHLENQLTACHEGGSQPATAKSRESQGGAPVKASEWTTLLTVRFLMLFVAHPQDPGSASAK